MPFGNSNKFWKRRQQAKDRETNAAWKKLYPKGVIVRRKTRTGYKHYVVK